MDGPYMPFLFFAVGLAIGAVMVLAVCGGGGGAVAATQSSSTSGLVSFGQEVVEVGPEEGGGSEIRDTGGRTNSVLTSEDGGRAVITGGTGTPAVFTDPQTGIRRNTICYTAVYCFEECPEGECPPCDECVETGEQCGYGPNYAGYLAAAPPAEAYYYGECCPPDVCIDGYCQPEEECVDYGMLCEYGPSEFYQTATHYQEPTWYGECCPPYDCVNGYCGREQECVDYGEVCRTDNDCCEGPCMDGRCWYEEEECVDYGMTCGYVAPAATTAYQAPVYHGECCPPYECIDNRCGEGGCVETGGTCEEDGDCCEGYCGANRVCMPPEECNEEGETCGLVASTATTAYVPPTDHGDCCEGLECVGNVCTAPGGCSEYGEACGVGAMSCCEGLDCKDGVCMEGGEHECAAPGSDCGGYAGGLECCEGAVCYQGVCESKTDYMCSDSENGPSYYTPGHATGVYDGTYGTWNDYCEDSNHVVDYYCAINNEYLPVYSAMVTCPYGCGNGACISG